MFVDVRDQHTGKLLFRYDPERELVEVRVRGVTTLIDLSTYKDPPSAPERPPDR